MARKKMQPKNESWSRAQIIRQFDVHPRQLATWERQGLLEAKADYLFEDLLGIRVLLRLKELGVTPRKLRAVFESVRARLSNIVNPLTELRVYVEGKKIHVQTAGRKMEAMSGQLLLDFDQGEIRRLLHFPTAAKEDPGALRRVKGEAERWFQSGLDLEQRGADKREAIAAYERAIALNPLLAGALVNIGTIYFNARKWRESEKFYQQAIAADPAYPLAHFNIANLHEELGRTSLAIQHYKKALELQPLYADAHYNLALLFQTRGRSMEALRHWKLYLKLDPSSHWASIAKRELSKLKDSAVVCTKPAAEPSGTA